MIPQNSAVATVSGNMTGKRVHMQMSKAAMRFIMNMLTDLYSDPELACIREYSTNAWDSHLEAGTKRPIEVTTPNKFHPYLTVKDYGTGMNAEDIEMVYAWYGESTKRDKEDQNGVMGVGAKSALGYTTQFTVQGIKNGVKTLIIVSRLEDGTGAMDIVAESETDEPNGVTIQIPVREVNHFESKAKEFFKFWKKGTVILNDAEPAIDLEKMSDRLYLFEGTDDVVVMGNVAYPISSSYRLSQGEKRVALFVDMNRGEDVSFTPSREALLYNEITKATLVGAREEFNAAFAKHLQGTIDNAPNFLEAWRLYNEMRRTYSHGIYSQVKTDKWAPKLDDFPIRYDSAEDGVVVKRDKKVIRWETSRNRYAVQSCSLFYSRLAAKRNRVIVNYTGGDGVAGGNKRRISSWFKKNDPDKTWDQYSDVILVRESSLPMPEVTKFVKVYDWKTIQKETRVEREKSLNVGPKNSANGQYRVVNPSTHTVDLQDVSSKAEVIYWSDAQNAEIYGPSYDELERAGKWWPNLIFIRENANRHGKLRRSVKKATSWPDFYSTYRKRAIEEDFKALTDDQVEVYAYKDVYTSYLIKEVTGVEQTLFRTYWTPRTIDKIEDAGYRKVLSMYLAATPEIGQAANHPDWIKRVEEMKPALVRYQKDYYPLVNKNSLSDCPEVVIEYVNEKFAQMNGEK